MIHTRRNSLNSVCSQGRCAWIMTNRNEASSEDGQLECDNVWRVFAGTTEEINRVSGQRGLAWLDTRFLF